MRIVEPAPNKLSVRIDEVDLGSGFAGYWPRSKRFAIDPRVAGANAMGDVAGQPYGVFAHLRTHTLTATRGSS